MTDRITPRQLHESEGVEDWRVLGVEFGPVEPMRQFGEHAKREVGG